MDLGRENLIGSLVDGRYLVEEKLGSGGIGVVYLARDLKVLGRKVVVKVLLETSLENEYVVKKFRQEAEALSRLDHPNIVSIYDYGEMQGGHPYLVIQYIEGSTLRNIIRPGGVEPARAALIIRSVAHALTAAHDKGILHRDLKPENIMLQTFADEERVVVIDFGIAHIQDSVIAQQTVITMTAGTIYYMSPEQLCGGSLTPASDTYALGVIAYELMTGQKPFNPQTPYQLLEMQRARLATPPRELRPDLPEAAQEVILRALSLKPEDRQHSTREFGNDLHRIFTGASPTSVEEHAPAPPPPAAPPAPLTPVPAPARPTAPNAASTDGVVPEPHPQPVPDLPPVEAKETQPPPPNPTSPPREALTPPPAPVPVAPPTYTPVPVPTPQPAPAWQQNKAIIIAAGALLVFSLAAVVALGIWLVNPKPASTTTNANTTTTPTPSGPEAARLSLEFSLTVQLMRNGKPYREQFQSTGRDFYENGTLFRVNVLTPKSGYLYMLNEGPNKRGDIIYSLLFPTMGEAHITGGQKVLIPGIDEPTYKFEGGTGTEKFWVIFSDQPVPEMEELKSLMNPENNFGDVTNPTQISTVREFLKRHDTSKTTEKEDKVNKVIKIDSSDEVLVHLFELEHH